LNVRHFADAAGGQNPESIPAAVGRMRGGLSETSAVTSADYERLALGTPDADVARVKAVPSFTPDTRDSGVSKTAMCVVAVPYADGGLPQVSDQFLEKIMRRLEPFRLLTTQLYVIGPIYAAVSVGVSVKFKSGCAPDSQKISDALDAFLSPLGDGGAYKGWQFGRTVYKSEIYRVIKQTDGVDFAGGITLSASGEGFDSYANGNVKLSPISLVYGGRHTIDIL
jgi:predicted phage baseplate assembly protein